MIDPAHSLASPAPVTLNEDEHFNPVVYHVDQYDAVMATRDLEQSRVTMNGSIEQYSGIHPTYGRCVIVISNSSSAVIVPLS